MLLKRRQKGPIFGLFSADFVLILTFLVLLAVVIREQKEGFGSRFTTARRTGDFRMRPKSLKISRNQPKIDQKLVPFGDVFKAVIAILGGPKSGFAFDL